MDPKEVWFNELYLEHRKRLLRTAYEITRDLAGSEDLVEAVFEKLYNKYESIKDHPNIAGWLARVLYNQIGSDSQKAYRHREVVPHPGFEPAAAPRGEDFMNLLPPGLSKPERQILYLHIEAGYPHEEIARILGCSVTAARMRYSRARRHCKELMVKESEKPCHIRRGSTNKKDGRCSDV